MKKIFLSLIVVFLSFGYANAMSDNDIDALWNKANSSYAQLDFNLALADYLQLEQQAGVSAKLYYNIGNAYYKTGQLAKAILYFNRAEVLDPANKDIKHNLSVANAMTTNKIEAIPEFFAVKWIRALQNMMSSNQWGMFSLVAIGFTLFMGLLFWFSQQSLVRKTTFTIGGISLVLFFVALILGSMQRSAVNNSASAVIMRNSVAVKSSPDNSGKDIFVLNEGIKVDVGERIGEWVKVTVSSGQNGWVENQSIEVI